jgi:Xaa-Pro aminopeptidase
MDCERISRIQEHLHTAALAAVVCSLPSNVLLLTGYWPVVGESIAICVHGGPNVLLVPEDEAELAGAGFADSVETFASGTLSEMTSVSEAVKPHLANTLHKLNIRPGPIGVESGASSQAASYLAINLYGNDLPDILRELLPNSTFIRIEGWIETLKSIKVPAELEKIRQACAIAKKAYELAAPQLRAGMREPEAAQLLQARLSSGERRMLPTERCSGFAFCMSGPNSAKAYAAYARTRERALEPADLVMMHCNSYVDGFWTDVTRTFILQAPDKLQDKIYAAILAARRAALATIEPGVRAAEVDSAARQVIQDFELGQYLKHGTGHGVGFSAMSSHSRPRIHAGSQDVLEEGMVFNLEPAVYIEGYGGVRHCDMVAVTNRGYELLTEFQSDIEHLTASAIHSVQTRAI